MATGETSRVAPDDLPSTHMAYETLTRRIIGCAMRVHRALGPGFLESVYQNALAWELRTGGVRVECARRLHVHYRDALVGEFIADMIVDEAVLVENKAVCTLAPVHAAQVVNYLTATDLEVGLLLNFGSGSLQVRRLTRTREGERTTGGRDSRDWGD